MRERPKHMLNAITWQAFTYMKICLENMRDGKYPNGKKFKEKDYKETQANIDRSIEVLSQYGCSLPVLEAPKVEQLQLFTP